jgi:hypothetical protein
VVEGDEGVRPWGRSGVGEDGRCGRDEAGIEGIEGGGAGGGFTDGVVELEAWGPLDLVLAGRVERLAACTPIALPRVGPLSGGGIGSRRQSAGMC